MGHIIVTGAGSGLGRALTIGLVERGHKVSMMGRRYHKLQEQEQRLGSAVVGIAAGMIALGDVITGWQWAGIALIVAALICTMFGGRWLDRKQ